MCRFMNQCPNIVPLKLVKLFFHGHQPTLICFSFFNILRPSPAIKAIIAIEKSQLSTLTTVILYSLQQIYYSTLYFYLNIISQFLFLFFSFPPFPPFSLLSQFLQRLLPSPGSSFPFFLVFLSSLPFKGHTERDEARAQRERLSERGKRERDCEMREISLGD